jgi:hypothetical protein
MKELSSGKMGKEMEKVKKEKEKVHKSSGKKEDSKSPAKKNMTLEK